MQFRLIYEGLLLGQNCGAAHKWNIRKAFHPQLAKLWTQEPLASFRNKLLADSVPPGSISSVRQRHSAKFFPLVTFDLKLFAEIDVLLFRAEEKGTTSRKDADNQLKTLLDSLRMPDPRQNIDEDIPSPFYCLLEDDCLVTRVGIETEQLLLPRISTDSLVVINVQIKPLMTTYANLGF